MSNETRKCLACGGATEIGFLVDRGHTSRGLLGEWWAGPPEYSIWGFVREPKRRFKIQSLRCTRCGLLMDYALPEQPEIR